MRAAITLLVLLFSMSGAQTRSTQTEVQTESLNTAAATADEVSTQLDVSAELKELRDMVVELRVLLTVTQNEVDTLKSENAAQEAEFTAELTAVKIKMAVTETDMDHLKKYTAAQHTDLAAMKTEVTNLSMENAELKSRLAATVTEVEDLKLDSAAHEQELAALKTRLATSETGIADLNVEYAAQEAELTAVNTRLVVTEAGVENLQDLTVKSKVAFSAGLTDSGYIQAGSSILNLVFSRVITNVGQAYSGTTGFFTAPVRGVYYFRFSVMDSKTSHWMHIQLFKNGKSLMFLAGFVHDGYDSYLSSGLSLELEVGDVVNLGLPPNKYLYDDANNYSTFSGFLLFLI